MSETKSFGFPLFDFGGINAYDKSYSHVKSEHPTSNDGYYYFLNFRRILLWIHAPDEPLQVIVNHLHVISIMETLL